MLSSQYAPSKSLLDKAGGLPWFMVMTIVAIASFGAAILVSATLDAPQTVGTLAEASGGEAARSGMAGQHMSRFLITLIGAIGLALTPIRFWAHLAYPAYLFAMILLVGVEVAGVEAGGAQRWLQIGPVRVQPSEFMKLTLILALARYYHQAFQSRGARNIWVHAPALLIIACPMALILHQPDLGTSLVLAATGGMVVFFAGLPMRYIAGAVALVVIAAPTAYFFVLADYQKARVDTFLDPSSDPLGAGYQIQQAKIAIGAGGWSGKGYMQGTQSQLEYIPEQHTDFVFTVIAEEFGFWGSMLVLVAWGAALVQGLVIAHSSKNTFGSLAAGGVVAMLAFYVVVNIGMVMGLMPVVGVPLPLISYGGTAMLTVMAGFGLLMSVHLHKDQDITLAGLA